MPPQRLSDNWLARMREIGCSLRRVFDNRQYVCALAMPRCREPEVTAIVSVLKKAGILCRVHEPGSGGLRVYCFPQTQDQFDTMFRTVYPYSREGVRKRMQEMQE